MGCVKPKMKSIEEFDVKTDRHSAVAKSEGFEA